MDGQISNGILVILVGWSGVGKSTFVKGMNCQDLVFEISRSVKDELTAAGKEITHDAIMSIAHGRYQDDPLWQVESILTTLRSQGALVLDGCRNAMELRHLRKVNRNTLVVHIHADKYIRYAQLLERGDVTSPTEFQHIVRNEEERTQLNVILRDLVDITVENNGYLQRLMDIGEIFGGLIRGTIGNGKSRAHS